MVLTQNTEFLGGFSWFISSFGKTLASKLALHSKIGGCKESMASGRSMRAICPGEKNVEENISPQLSSLTTGKGNFERRAKLRGLRSQEELLSAQHICRSLHLLECLSRGFGIQLAVQGAQTGWYLQPGWTNPGCHQDLSVSVLCHFISA